MIPSPAELLAQHAFDEMSNGAFSPSATSTSSLHSTTLPIQKFTGFYTTTFAPADMMMMTTRGGSTENGSSIGEGETTDVPASAVGTAAQGNTNDASSTEAALVLSVSTGPPAREAQEPLPIFQGVSGEQLSYWQRLEQEIRQWCPHVVCFIQTYMNEQEDQQQRQQQEEEQTEQALGYDSHRYDAMLNEESTSAVNFESSDTPGTTPTSRAIPTIPSSYSAFSPVPTTTASMGVPAPVEVSQTVAPPLPNIPALTYEQIMSMNRIYNNAFVTVGVSPGDTRAGTLPLPADYIGFSVFEQNKACIVHRIEAYQRLSAHIAEQQQPHLLPEFTYVPFYLDQDPTHETLPKDLVYNFPLLANTLQWFIQQSHYASVLPPLRIYALCTPVSTLNRQSIMTVRPYYVHDNVAYIEHLRQWNMFKFSCHVTRLDHVDCLFCHVSYLSITAHACGHGGGQGYPATESNVPLPMRSVLYESPMYPEFAPAPHPYTLGVLYRFDTIVRAIQLRCFPRRNRQPVFQQYRNLMRHLMKTTLQRHPHLQHQNPLELLHQFEEQILEYQWNILLKRNLSPALHHEPNETSNDLSPSSTQGAPLAPQDPTPVLHLKVPASSSSCATSSSVSTAPAVPSRRRRAPRGTRSKRTVDSVVPPPVPLVSTRARPTKARADFVSSMESFPPLSRDATALVS